MTPSGVLTSFPWAVSPYSFSPGFPRAINRLTRVAGVHPLRSEKLLEKSRMKNIVKTAAALALLAGASQAFAAEVTDTIQVTATINSACTIDSAADLVFPATDTTTLASAAQTATADIAVTCSNGTAVQVGLSGGTSGDVNARVLTHTDGTSTLTYGLFTDAGLTTNWGNTPGNDTQDYASDGTTQTLTIHGQLDAQTAPIIGDYSDTVTVTVTY